jgi:hypothetical protein
MDASDDRDIKLQRVSGDLLADFEKGLPVLLWSKSRGDGTRGHSRRRVKERELTRLILLVGRLVHVLWLQC